LIVQHFIPASARGLVRFCSAFAIAAVLATPLAAQSTPFTRSLAEAASQDEGLAGFYRDRGYATLWTAAKDAPRRQALLAALAQAGAQGLPQSRYGAHDLVEAAQSVQTEGDLGRLEVAFSQAFLRYATDLNSGALTPKKVDGGILREIIRLKPADLLNGIATATRPQSYLRSLAPQAPEYARLVKAKLTLEAGLGQETHVAAGKLQQGDKGEAVIALRDRLTELGYLPASASAEFDAGIRRAVQRFQLDQGIEASGIVGGSTVEALNESARTRLESVTVALERMRWMANTPLGGRHIWVNQPSFTAQIIDEGRVTFETRAVIGKNVPDQRSPEFSDQMEYMVVNPSWGVPRSIIVKEYLPLLQRNPNAVSHLQVIDGAGRVVSRGAVNFAAYSARTFPFGLRQPPSDGNALGKVKFMFPNPYNIYLHDTPAKALFGNEMRAYSHGCIRLGDPFDFAYALLSKQSADPKGEFADHLATKRENSVSLKDPVPVHLVYYTAWPTPKGMIGYRPDVYGRDAKLFEALTEAGVVLPEVQG
jgi:L,D-transpeptidase YcbB